MKNFIAIMLASTFLVACGEVVEVPPATKGKILTKNGYKPESVPPSKFRLDPCIWYCDKLILADASDIAAKEDFKLFMPRDQLNMSFDIRMTASIRDDATAIDSIFDRVVPTATKTHPYIPAQAVYEIYVQPVLRDVIRAKMAEYSINEIASSRERISNEIRIAVDEALKNKPMTIKQLGLADVQFPDVITKQKEKAAERRIKIEEQEAEREIQRVRLQIELEGAKAQRSIRRENAEAAREENLIFAESVTDDYLAYKRLEVLNELAKNGNSVFVPYDALDQLGLSNRIFNKELPAKEVTPK